MTPRIVVLEKMEMTTDQREKLQALGDVAWFDFTPEECEKRPEECRSSVKDADVVVINWIAPNPFLSSMKRPSLLALMSTGYGWIDIKKARELDISVSNVPGYATEAVAEHIIGLALAVARKTHLGDRNIRQGKEEKGYLRGFELRNRIMGIIGLGKIGRRVAGIANCFGMEVITYNRTPKNLGGVFRDVPLRYLLKSSDVVCITCPLNEESKDMLDLGKLKLMKKDAILVGTTWGVVKIEGLIHVLKNKLIYGAGLDVAIEAEKIELPKELIKLDNILLTPHVGFNTVKAKRRQVDICISNIHSYITGKPQNIVN